MTTTLRPREPEIPLPGGRGRCRLYAVCVNGRPVGSVRITSRMHPGGQVGEISELRIDEGRRRGRGTVAALAAEEVLRGWGCRRVEVWVPSEEGLLRFASALGYTEYAHTVGKRLSIACDLPMEYSIRSREREDRPVRRAYGEALPTDHLLAGSTDWSGATPTLEEDAHDRLRYGNSAMSVAVLLTLVAGGVEVGWVSVSPARGEPGEEGLDAWIHHLEVASEHRGRGYGRALMGAAERRCLATGARMVGVRVPTRNPAVAHLCGELGYQVTGRLLGKPLL